MFPPRRTNTRRSSEQERGGDESGPKPAQRPLTPGRTALRADSRCGIRNTRIAHDARSLPPGCPTLCIVLTRLVVRACCAHSARAFWSAGLFGLLARPPGATQKRLMVDSSSPCDQPWPRNPEDGSFHCLSPAALLRHVSLLLLPARNPAS